MGWLKNNDKIHVTVAGVNPHHVATDMGDTPDRPFYDEISRPCSDKDIIVDGKIVGGVVEAYVSEHLTPEQETYLANHPNVIDVRHVPTYRPGK